MSWKVMHNPRWPRVLTCSEKEWVCQTVAETCGVQVYAAEAEVAAAQAKDSRSSPDKRAEEAWNERIKGAYAAIAAATPYRPAAKKPSSHALSWHRCAAPKKCDAPPELQLADTHWRGTHFAVAGCASLHTDAIEGVAMGQTLHAASSQRRSANTLLTRDSAAQPGAGAATPPC